MPTTLQTKYNKEAVSTLMKKFGYKNIMAVPKISKITVNSSFGKNLTGKTGNEARAFCDYIANSLAQITGQKPKLTKARKSIAGFKLRAGAIIGACCVLRGARMYEFLEKVIKVVLPRLRDFRGIKLNSFDEQGNLTIGFKEYAPFPELKVEREKGIFGLEVVITTTAKTKKEGIELLRLLGLPLERNK